MLNERGWLDGLLDAAGDLPRGMVDMVSDAIKRTGRPGSRNLTGVDPTRFQALLEGKTLEPVERPGLLESLVDLSPVGALKEAWKASNDADKSGYEGGKAVGTALASLASLGIPLARKDKVRAYHGSRTAHDSFDPAFLGTGEGGDMFGRGFYFAENPDVSFTYRDMFERGQGKVSGPHPESPEFLARNVLDSFRGDYAKAIDELEARRAAFQSNPRWNSRGWDKKAEQAIDMLSKGESLTGAKFYTVDINSPAESFLNLDVPMRAQTQEALKPLRIRNVDLTTRTVPYSDALKKSIIPDFTPNKMFDLKNQTVVDALSDLGIPGTKYFDRNSRSAQSGTRNYVVFPKNAHLIEILGKYGALPVGAGAALSALGDPDSPFGDY